MKIQCTMLLLVYFIISSSVLAEEVDNSDGEQPVDKFALMDIDQSLPEISMSEIFSGATSAFIYTGTDKKIATLRFGQSFSEADNWKWDMSIQAPYDSENDPTILSDFDGLSNISNISYNLSRFHILDRKDYSKALDEGQKTLCHIYSGIPRDEGCTTEDIKKNYLTNKKLGRVCATLTDDQCTELAMKQYLKEEFKLYSSLVKSGDIEPVKANIYGAKLKVGYDDYSFKNPSNLEDEKSNETSWSFSAYYNYLKHNTVYGLGLEIQKSFKENPEIQLCEPFEPFEGTTSCSNVRVGAPTRQKRSVLFVQMSHYLENKNFALQPKISYDFEEDEIGISVPIYLMRNEKGLLTGGLQVGWQSEDNDVVAGIFIGKAFELF